MATAIHIQTTVLPGGKIEIASPDLLPGQKATVFVVVDDQTQAKKQSAIDILRKLPGHHEFQTAAEVDAYIREERDSWDR